MTLTSVKDRPVIKLRYSLTEWVLEMLGIAGFALCFGLLAFNWSTLPERVPSHYTFSGEVNGWSSKETLAVVPLVLLLVYTGLTALVRVPHYFNYPFAITPGNAERQYRLARLLLFFIKTFIAGIAAFIIGQLVASATSAHPAVSMLFLPIMIGMLFAGIAIYLVIAFRNR